jgi:hypothetical protein
VGLGKAEGQKIRQDGNSSHNNSAVSEGEEQRHMKLMAEVLCLFPPPDCKGYSKQAVSEENSALHF